MEERTSRSGEMAGTTAHSLELMSRIADNTRQTLLETQRIRKNVVFFCWVFIASLVLGGLSWFIAIVVAGISLASIGTGY